MPRELLPGGLGGDGAWAPKDGQEPDPAGPALVTRSGKGFGLYNKGSGMSLQDFMLGSYWSTFVFSNCDSAGMVCALETSEGQRSDSDPSVSPFISSHGWET